MPAPTTKPKRLNKCMNHPTFLKKNRHPLLSTESFIRQTLRLARRASGRTQTNPLVGAILTRGHGSDEAVVAVGYHRGYGDPHAEVEAIRNAKRLGYTDLSGMTLYVNLEPCCHYGKTPPCTDVIIEQKIARVVCGTKDPFPAVAGKGIRKLRRAGIAVVTGVLEKECRELNRNFFKHVQTGLPRITLKAAQTLDGKMATQSGSSKWITGERSRTLVHRMRTQYDAVCVGAGTVIADNPALTVRHARGPQPWRIIVDGKLRCPLNRAVFNDSMRHRTIVLTNRPQTNRRVIDMKRRGVIVHSFSGGSISLKRACRFLLRQHRIASILVEGGPMLHGQFLKERITDDVAIFIAPILMGRGRTSMDAYLIGRVADAIPLRDIRLRRIGRDFLVTGNL